MSKVSGEHQLNDCKKSGFPVVYVSETENTSSLRCLLTSIICLFTCVEYISVGKVIF